MDVLSLLPVSIDFLLLFTLVMTRVAAFLGMITVLRKNIFNVRILVAFTGLIAFVVVMSVGNKMALPNKTFISLAIACIAEILNGFIFSLVVNFMFDIFSSGGQMIALWTGMSSAAIIDPALGGTTDITRFYVYLVVLIFFLMNGHLELFYAIAKSFQVFPPGKFALRLLSNPSGIVLFSSYIFSFGLLLSLPVMLTLLLVNLSLALASRFSPQLSIFSVGITLLVITGMIWLYITFDQLVAMSSGLLFKFIKLIVKLLAGY